MATYTWIDGTMSDIDTMTADELTRYRAEFFARSAEPQPTEAEWVECCMCGRGVSPQAAVYGMPIHGKCWQHAGFIGREKIAHEYGMSYDAADELLTCEQHVKLLAWRSKSR